MSPPTAPDLERFDLANYAALIAHLQRRRTVCAVGDLPQMAPDQPLCVLRHDVDFSPARALRLAEWEHAHGWRASYFLLLNSPHYNLLESACLAVPSRLVELGHEVGLHYDVGNLLALAAHTGAEPESLLRQQCGLLANLSGAPVTAIALHNPSLTGADPFPRPRGLINSYTALRDYGLHYVSDSCGGWGNDGAALLAADDGPTRIQLLTHPLFWAHDGHRDRWQALAACVAEWREDVAQRERIATDNWRAHRQVREHDARAAATTGNTP